MSKAVYHSDVVLIGAGIMSATLGAFLKELSPQKSISIFEKLPAVALESSNEWNNAGTGHAALCELNYTPENADGSVDISKAISINQKFQLSLEMWSYLVEQGKLSNPQEFIHQLPHISFVQGEKDVKFLKTRFEALSKQPFFSKMVLSEDKTTLSEWMPLMMSKRQSSEPIAATYIKNGTDVNFGALTRQLFSYLSEQGAELKLNHTVKDIKKTAEGWELSVSDASGQDFTHFCKFIFIGCGGGSLPLLQKTGIPESKHIGGFPVSGLFLVCKNPDIIAQHHAKVYGKAKVGAPPMSVPHLDTRFIEGKQSLLFGPFAGFTMKFLKSGSIFDLATSVKPHNFMAVHWAGIKNLPLAHYLVKQVLLTKEQRMEELREFIPQAKSEDWDIVIAGQRVQIIKDTPDEKGKLCFGTESIVSADGSIAALLGASPGASTSVDAMLEILQKCFATELPEWQEKLNQMVPSLNRKFSDEAEIEAHQAKIASLLKF